MKVHVTTNLKPGSILSASHLHPAPLESSKYRAAPPHCPIPQQQLVHGYAHVHVPFSLPSSPHFSTSWPITCVSEQGKRCKAVIAKLLIIRKVETRGQSKSPAYSSIWCLFKNICILGIVSSPKWLSDIGTGCQGKWFNHYPWKCSKGM